MGRALRFQVHMLIHFWAECVLVATSLINRTPTPLLRNKTPFQILINQPPSFHTIHTFLCFAHIQKMKGDKLASQRRKYVFLGYPFRKKRVEGV